MGVPATASWTITKIFNLRGIVQVWIKHITGNGVGYFFWLDNWHPLGHLFSRFGQGSFQFGEILHAKVETVIRDDTWCWPRRRNTVTKEIMDNTHYGLILIKKILWSVT